LPPNETSDWGVAEARWWWSAGLERLEHTVKQVRVSKLSEKAGRIEVQSVSFAGGKGQSFRNRYVFDVLASGHILLKHTVTPEGDRVPWLPKLGLQMEIGKAYRNLTWYGRGPFETYPDRKTGAKIGTYKGTVEEQFVPYLVGQDQGNKADVRWAALADDKGNGLAIFAEPEMNFSVHEHGNLDRAVYAFQLRKKDSLTVNIDHRVTGVGGTPVTARPPFRTYPGVYEYAVRLRPFSAKDPPASELARQQPAY